MRILLLILIFSSNLWAYGYNPVNEEIIVLEQAYRDLLNEYAQKKHKYESEKRKRDLLYLELKKCKSDCLDINNEIKKIEKGLPILKWYVDDYKQRKLKEYFSKRESLDYKKQISAKAITLLRELQYDRSPKNIQNAKNFLTSINGHENESTQKLVNFLKDHGELKRDYYYETDNLNGVYPYDASKSVSDIICQSYSKTYNSKIGIVRSANIYGECDFNFNRIVPETIISIPLEKSLQLILQSSIPYSVIFPLNSCLSFFFSLE